MHIRQGTMQDSVDEVREKQLRSLALKLQKVRQELEGGCPLGAEAARRKEQVYAQLLVDMVTGGAS